MRTKMLFTAVFGLAALAAAMPAEARINQRQDRQQQRIFRGIASGELTARETYRLARQQGRIAGYEARSRADGPGLTGRERYRLERMQDRASRSIYRRNHPSGR
jgi:hypothetical protein